MQQEAAKNDVTDLNDITSKEIIEKLRSDLHFSQKQIQRIEEEQQLSRAAFEESRKVLIECGKLRSELKEKDDLLKEAQSLVFDQESTISLLQGNMRNAEIRNDVQLRAHQDQINLLKVVIEDLKAQWQHINNQQIQKVAAILLFHYLRRQN